MSTINLLTIGNGNSNLGCMEETFGQRLRRLRLAAGYGLNEFADMVGISKSYLSRIEREERLVDSEPRRAQLKKMAGLLRVSEAELLGEEDSIPEEIEDVPEIQRVPLAELLERIGAKPVAGEFVEGLKLSAGQGSFLIQGFDESRPRKRRSKPQPERIQVIEVEGHCMERVLYPGDKVLVDTQRMPTIGEVTAAVRFHHDSIVKFLREKEGEQFFQGEDGTIVPLDKHIRIIGPVVDVQRSIWRMIEEAR